MEVASLFLCSRRSLPFKACRKPKGKGRVLCAAESEHFDLAQALTPATTMKLQLPCLLSLLARPTAVAAFFCCRGGGTLC